MAGKPVPIQLPDWLPPEEWKAFCDHMRELKILSAIGASERVSQRRLASIARISTTMINADIARLERQ